MSKNSLLKLSWAFLFFLKKRNLSVGATFLSMEFVIGLISLTCKDKE